MQKPMEKPSQELLDIIYDFQSRLHSDRTRAAVKLDEFLKSQQSVVGMHILIDILKNEESDLIQKDTLQIIANNSDRLKASAFELTPRLINVLASNQAHLISGCAQILQEFVRQSWIPLNNLLPSLFPLIKSKNALLVEKILSILLNIQPYRYSQTERTLFYRKIAMLFDKTMIPWMDLIAELFMGINPIDGESRKFFYDFITNRLGKLNLSSKNIDIFALLLANNLWSIPTPWKQRNRIQFSKKGKIFAINENIIRKYMQILLSLQKTNDISEIPDHLEEFLSPLFYLDCELVNLNDHLYYESKILFRCTIKAVFQNISFGLSALPKSINDNLTMLTFDQNSFQLQVLISKDLKYIHPILCPLEVFDQKVSLTIPLILFTRDHLPEWGFVSSYHLPDESHLHAKITRSKAPWNIDEGQAIKVKCIECGLENIVIVNSNNSNGSVLFYCEFCGQKNNFQSD